MDKASKMTKRIPAIGVKTEKGDSVAFDAPVPVLFKGKDGCTKGAAFVELADTPERRERGLSKRASLGRMGGMVRRSFLDEGRRISA